VKQSLVALGAAGALLPFTAHAGRPLSSDDASTADTGTCQLESWLERAGRERAWAIAPACGIAKGMEVGADYTLPHPRDTLRATGGLAFKWVPEGWLSTTSAGELNFGVKLNASMDHPTGAGWHRSETSVLALATLKPSDALAVHANLGAAHEHTSRTTATLLNLAIAWTPGEQALLFAETQANSKRTVFGGTVNTAGARWWLVPDRFGLDLSASRQAGAAIGTLWTLGLGWYGLAF
jgi:hypothetical protein